MKCIVLSALVAVASLSYAQMAEIPVQGKTTFLDIIKHLEDKGSIRFLSMVNWYEMDNTVPIETKLIDEAYSMEKNSGRMVVHKGILSNDMIDLNLFAWSPEVGGLNTTMCASIEASSPLDTGLIFPIDCLKELLMFHKVDETRPVKLYGLTAILANVIEKHSDKLIKMDEDVDDKLHEVYMLDIGCGCIFEFRFTKLEESKPLTIENIKGLVIDVFETKKMDGTKASKGRMIAKLTVLKIQDKVKEDILPSTKGYTCHHGVFVKTLKPRMTRSVGSDGIGESGYKVASEIDDRLNREHMMTTMDDWIPERDFTRRGLFACAGMQSCSGQGAGTGKYSCSGQGSCPGERSGAGDWSCSGASSCQGQNSGWGRNSCSGQGSCSGRNSGNCPNSCSAIGSCSADNSCD